MSEDLKALGIEETAVLRPGDTLILRVTSTGLSPEAFEQLAEQVKGRLPDVKVLVVGVDGMAVYRPDATECTCPLFDMSTIGGVPEFVRGDPASSRCPVHFVGSEYSAKVEDAKRRAREAS